MRKTSAASPYDRLSRSQRHVHTLTSSDVLATARALRRLLKGHYVPGIIAAILRAAQYEPQQHVRVRGFLTVEGSVCYLASEPVAAPVARVRAAAHSRNTACYNIARPAAALSSWWSFRRCAPGREQILGRRLYSRAECPVVFANDRQVSDFQEHSAEVHADAASPDALSSMLADLRSGEVLCLVAHAYPNFANCCEEASLQIFAPLDFDLSSDPRLWGGPS